MDRLTRYDKKQKHYIRLASRLAVDNTLGKLEDLEEQLGCPLEVLFKALENGIYTIDKTWYSLVNLYFSDRNLYCQAKFKNSIVVHIKDYKKSWWLKEDKTE